MKHFGILTHAFFTDCDLAGDWLISVNTVTGVDFTQCIWKLWHSLSHSTMGM